MPDPLVAEIAFQTVVSLEKRKLKERPKIRESWVLSRSELPYIVFSVYDYNNYVLTSDLNERLYFKIFQKRVRVPRKKIRALRALAIIMLLSKTTDCFTINVYIVFAGIRQGRKAEGS